MPSPNGFSQPASLRQLPATDAVMPSALVRSQPANVREEGTVLQRDFFAPEPTLKRAPTTNLAYLPGAHAAVAAKSHLFHPVPGQ